MARNARKKQKKSKKENRKSIARKRFLIILLILAGIVLACGAISYFSWKSRATRNAMESAYIIETSAGKVQYASMGKGPVILISHGAGFGWDAIRLYEDLAREGYRLICPSRPGYLSTPLSSGKTINAQASMMAALLDALEIHQPVFVLATSLGGPAGIAFCLDHPGRCRGLILMDAITQPYNPEPSEKHGALPGVYDQKGGSDFTNWIMHLASRYKPKNLLTRLLKAHTLYNRDQCSEMSRSVLQNPSGAKKLRTMVDIVSPMSLRKKGLENDRAQVHDLRLSIENLNIPILLCHSRQDRQVPYEHAEHVMQKVPEAELYAFNGCGHLFWIGKEWDGISDRTLQFLTLHTHHKQTKSHRLEGTWVSETDGAMLSVSAAGNFTIDLPSVEETLMWHGSLKIDGQTVTIHLDGEKDSLCKNRAGKYAFRLQNDILQFNVHSDPCKIRRKRFRQLWRRL
ncbi:MAG: alpha/beta hydrolase [Bacteroidales bacterium]